MKVPETCVQREDDAASASDNLSSAHLAADQIGTKLVGSHGHFDGLVVLCWHVYVAHENAARGTIVSV